MDVRDVTAQFRQLGKVIGAACAGGVTLVLVGCGAQDDRVLSSATVRDSSGIRIVESTSLRSAAPGGWSLASEPSLSIGELAGDSSYLFSRVVGALRLGDGGIVVGDERSGQLRYFNDAGRLVTIAGGWGDGPGEFSRLRMLARCGGDAIYAFGRGFRASVFSESGQYLRTLPQIVEPEGAPPQATSCDQDGRFLTMGWDLRAGIGYWRAEFPLRLRTSEGELLVELGPFPGLEYIGEEGGAAPHPLTKYLVSAVSGGEVYVGTGDSHEMRVFGDGGSLAKIFRWEGRNLRFTVEDLELYRQRRLERAPPERRAGVERALRELDMPDRWPAYRSLRVDAADLLWLEEYPRNADPTAFWTVIGTDGTVLGRMELPHDLRLTEIGIDYVLGVSKDPLDVERVELYQLSRGPSG